MGQDNPKTKCQACGTETEAPKFWRGRAFCSPACMQKAIAARDQRVAEAAAHKEQVRNSEPEKAPEPPKPSKKKASPKEES